jgi:hypothetical protein
VTIFVAKPNIMKQFIFFIVISFFLGVSSVDAQYNERDWHWKPYASLMKNNKTFMVLYYGTAIKGYDGTVRWRVENRTAKPLFKVTLNTQTFELRNGDTVVFDKRYFKTRRLSPGESAMTLILKIEEGELSGIQNAAVEAPELMLDFGNDRVYEWSKLGKIEKSVQ